MISESPKRYGQLTIYRGCAPEIARPFGEIAGFAENLRNSTMLTERFQRNDNRETQIDFSI